MAMQYPTQCGSNHTKESGMESESRVLGSYQLLGELGQSNLGTVYKGYDPNRNLSVEILALSPSLTQKTDSLPLLVEGLRTLERLQHPNIRTLFQVDQEGETCYLVMEMSVHRPLAFELERGPLPLDQAIEIARQIASALDYAHNRGQVHGNLHPDSILLDQKGHVILNELGLTRIIARSLSLDPEAIPGATSYRAPEVIAGEEATIAGDVYALGLILYETLGGESEEAQMDASVKKVLDWAMADDPTERPKSAGELASALQDAARGQLPAAVSDQTTMPLSTAAAEAEPAEVTAAEFPPEKDPWEALEQEARELEEAGQWGEAAAAWRRLYTTAWRHLYHQIRGVLQTQPVQPESVPMPTGRSRQEEKLRLAQMEIRPVTCLRHETPDFKGTALGVISMTFSHDGAWLIAGSEEGYLWLWSVDREELALSWRGHEGDIWGLSLSPDSPLLASASEDGTVGLWNVGTRQQVGRIKAGVGPVNTVAFSPDGLYLAIGGNDGTVRALDVRTSKEALLAVPGHAGVVYWVDYSMDNRLIASSSEDGTVALWDTQTGQEVRRWMPEMGPINTVAFSPDGSALAAGGDSGQIVLWDVHTGQKMRTLEGHSEQVNTLVFSPDGSLLASASADHTVRAWSAPYGWEIQVLERHSDWASTLAFSPDGALLASGSYDGTIWLWVLVEGAR
jgi:WD40 repeat protein